MSMNRVSCSRPCPVCKKSDWCLYGKDIAICMRVTSQRQKVFSDGSTGYLHRIDGAELPTLPPKKEKAVPFVDSGRLAQEWYQRFGDTSLTYLAKSLGVTRKSLEVIGCGKSPYNATWFFPMRDGKNYIIGLRLRHENGKKWCEVGGHNGLFIPQCPAEKEMVICEGPTDLAAALSIGLYGVGRFNCSGGVNQIQQFIGENKIKRAIIIADTDDDRVVNEQVVNPGISGAINLSEHLGIPSCTVTLPTKDLRGFVQKGGTLDVFKSLTAGLVWNNPKK